MLRPKIIRALLRLRGFTLIEMLAVIAIIGILAGLLIPAVVMVKKKARVAKATSDISGLSIAIDAYIADFGAPPPDSHDAPGDYGVAFQEMDTPNECLIWFLTREYRKNQNTTVFVHDTDSTNGFLSGSPQEREGMDARIQSAPYFGMNTKSTRDYDDVTGGDPDGIDGFDEFVDPWGRPYLYRAWRRRRIDRITRPSGNISRVFLGGHVAPGTGAEIEIVNTSNNNGNHTVTDTGVTGGDSWFDIDYAAGAAETPLLADNAHILMEPLHNPNKGYDLYSVGPNYQTNGSGATFTMYASPYGPEETAEVWGYAAAGNDLDAQRNGNVVNDDNARDDICNW